MKDEYHEGVKAGENFEVAIEAIKSPRHPRWP